MKKVGLWTLLVFSIAGLIYAGFVLMFGGEEKPVGKSSDGDAVIDVDHEEVPDTKTKSGATTNG